MCEELKERQKIKNINLGFTKFCKKTQQDNFNKFVKIGYIATQYHALSQGELLPDIEVIAKQFALDYKAAGFMDILNRQDDFVFNED